MALKYFLSALALTTSVLAQCGDGSDFTILSASDTSKFTGCTNWNGNIIIDSNTTGVVQIDYLRQITGDLRCNNNFQLNTIAAPQLQSISGAFRLENIQTLSTIQFDALTSVKQLIFIGLPNLYALQFTKGITTAADIYISNTMLRDLKGIELKTVDRWDVNNNNQLNTVNVNNLTNVTSAMSFSANGPNLNVVLPNLIGASNLTFRTLSSVDIPSLVEVPGSVGFYGDNFQNVSAANLTRIGGSFALVGNPNLMEFEFPILKLVNGGLIVANNTALKSIEGFPALSQIGGAIDFYGTFDAADLPALTLVKGAANIVTSSTNASICNSFNTQMKNQVISGQVFCYPNTADPTKNVSSSGKGKGNTASSATASISMALTGVVGLLAALFFL